ncbi:Delta-1-pyrroline-5-carboxylate dehydrogenase, mitochondrial [Trichinella nelsoni]|uniref:Delta-1-pyrroline-5-carboxylate dehydrogenase, mitochondrial n=1 Tax=Trichinella nelsoni TaxID=6336 RepID=A0A0V0SJ51_9BILA|nr:Delta-1-pyrroline-5-carboxylate dehydrogenase, mitochondrial [Trichinella nelsoni]
MRNQFIVKVLYAEINNSSFSKMSAVNKNNLHQPGTSNGRSVNSTSRNEVRYDMPFKPMYSNTLPDVPFEAKFLPHPFPADRHVKYETTMMERAYTGELVTEDDVGIFIDLVLIDKYEPNPNEPVQLHPTDELLCSDEDTLLSTVKKSRHGTKAVPWMRRTEYISTDYNRFGVQTERQETKLGYHIQKVLKEASLYRDRESQLTAINKTFEDAKKPVREHFSKRDVYAVEELPLLPDFDAWKYPFAQVIFDVDPAPRDKTSLEETLATDQICRAMIRGMMDEKGEQFVAYFVPTLETIRKLKSVEGKDISEMDLSTPFDFKLLREYNWSVKNKASVGYEENHFFSFRDGRAYYNELETRVRLNRRRVKDGHVHSAVPNSRLIVRYRDFNDQELAALSARSMTVNPIEEEDDDDDEEAEAEKHVDDTAGEKKLDTDQSNQPPAKDNNNQWSDNEVKSDEGSPVVEEETEEEIETFVSKFTLNCCQMNSIASTKITVIISLINIIKRFVIHFFGQQCALLLFFKFFSKEPLKTGKSCSLSSIVMTPIFNPVKMISGSRFALRTFFRTLTSAEFLKTPQNEPVLSYAPASDERIQLDQALARLTKQVNNIHAVIGNEMFDCGFTAEQRMPFDHKTVLARVAVCDKNLIRKAIDVALESRLAWERMPLEKRAEIFFKAADLASTKYRMDLNAATMLGQGKTVVQAEIDAACELVDFWRFNAYYALQLEKVRLISSNDIQNELLFRGLQGFVAAISPFNFTAIGSNMSSCPALMGNVVLWKPARTAMLSNYISFQILREAGLPDGVINFIPSQSEIFGEVVLSNRHLAGVGFVGSLPVFQHIWKVVGNNVENYDNFPRLSGECGGKNFHFIHHSADFKTAVACTARAAFEYQGQKCSACSRLYLPQSMWPEFKDALIEICKEIKIGDPRDHSVFMSAVIDRPAFENICSYIEHAKSSPSLKLLYGGDYDDEKGYFIHPTLLLCSDPNDRIMKEEIFGPVLTVITYPDAQCDEVLTSIKDSTEYALTGAIFAQDMNFIKQARMDLREACGNFYVNDKCTGAVVGQQPFGGSRKSGTNDKAGGPYYVLKWVSHLAVKSTRSPIHEWKYPSMGLLFPDAFLHFCTPICVILNHTLIDQLLAIITQHVVFRIFAEVELMAVFANKQEKRKKISNSRIDVLRRLRVQLCGYIECDRILPLVQKDLFALQPTERYLLSNEVASNEPGDCTNKLSSNACFVGY